MRPSGWSLRRCMLGGVAVLVFLVPFAAAPFGPAGAEARPERPRIVEAVPVPPRRPDRLGEPSPMNGAAASPAEPEAAAPLPPARPVDLAPIAAEQSVDRVAEEACQDRLARLGMRFEPLPALTEGACGAPSPIRVLSLPDGVEITSPATVTCPVAEAFGRWVLESAGAEAERHLGRDLVKILSGTSYECRGQNRQAQAKLSEHAYANALDIMGFGFRGQRDLPVTAQFGDTPEARFLAAVRAGACRYFSTVLGPGSDASHADHLHVDLRARRAGLRLCQ